MQSLQLKRKDPKLVVKKINEGQQKSKDDSIVEVLGMIELLSTYFHENFENSILKGPAIGSCLFCFGESDV